MSYSCNLCGFSTDNWDEILRHRPDRYSTTCAGHPQPMNDHDALLAIQKIMDGEEWNADTLDSIAQILRRAGYRVRDTDEYVRELDNRSMSSWTDEELKRYSRLTGQEEAETQCPQCGSYAVVVTGADETDGFREE